MEWFTTVAPHVVENWDRIVQAFFETVYMTGLSALISGGIGLGIGLLLVLTGTGGLWENRAIYASLDKVINIIRSVPFIILLALLEPFTRFLVHTTIGVNAAIVPLVVGSTGFYGRQIQNTLLEVSPGKIEAALAMGASTREIVTRVYLREGRVGIVRASAVTLINLIGLTTMAGVVGAGGLGNLAIQLGYNRHRFDVTIACTLLIILLVLLSQAAANWLEKKLSH